jgi:hypothetical protein
VQPYEEVGVCGRRWLEREGEGWRRALARWRAPVVARGETRDLSHAYGCEIKCIMIESSSETGEARRREAGVRHGRGGLQGPRSASPAWSRSPGRRRGA